MTEVIGLFPHYWFAYQRLAMVYGALGSYEKGVAAAEKAMSLAGVGTFRNGRETLAPLYAQSGRREEALQILTDLEEQARRVYVPPCDVARLHAALGHHDEAFQWLDRAIEVRDGDLFMTKVWPVWDPIRDDPRFDDLLDRLNLAGN